MTKANSDESIMIILHQLMHLSEYQAMRGLEQMDLKPGQAGILFWLGRKESCPSGGLPKNWDHAPFGDHSA